MTESSRSTAAPASRRAVVTGSAGFIGSHLAGALLDVGATVIGVDRRDTATDPEAAANLAPLLSRPRYISVAADLLTCAVEPLLIDADVVYHLAGIPGIRPSWGPTFGEYVSCNILAAQRVMDAAIRLRVPRLVVASSSSVYGASTQRPSDENDHPRPASPYAVTKLAEEQLCLAHAARPGCPTSVVALRYFTVFGPGQRPDMFIHRVLTAALTGTPLCLYGGGLQRRDFTYIDDVVAATIAAGTTPADIGIVNIGGGVNASLHDVIDIARRLTGRDIRIENGATRDGDVPITLANPCRARERLDWKPSVDLPSGMYRQLQAIALGVGKPSTPTEHHD